MKQITYLTSTLLTAGLLITCQDQAIENSSSADTAPAAQAEQVSCTQCGEVQSITPIKVKGEPRAGAAVAGAILGGVIGHQFGSGSGNDAATAAGAVGGAVAGSEIDRNRNSTTVYRVVVSLYDGGQIQRTLSSRNGLNIGDEVRLSGDQIIPLS